MTMNGVLDVLMTLVFFVPMAAMVAMSVAFYRDDRYTCQPPMPVSPKPVVDEPETYEELREAA